jgi:hypothetical protein
MPKAKALIAAATVGLVAATVVIRPAFAEAGQRICGQYYFATVRPGGSSGPEHQYSGAFMGKVANGDKAACQAVLDKIKTMDPKDLSDDKSIAWIPGDDLDPAEMTPCEELISTFGSPDPCPSMPESTSKEPNPVKFFLQSNS